MRAVIKNLGSFCLANFQANPCQPGCPKPVSGGPPTFMGLGLAHCVSSAKPNYRQAHFSQANSVMNFPGTMISYYGTNTIGLRSFYIFPMCFFSHFWANPLLTLRFFSILLQRKTSSAGPDIRESPQKCHCETFIYRPFDKNMKIAESFLLKYLNVR